MWYEVCIPAGIIVVTTSIPTILLPMWNRLTLGNAFNRYTDDPWVEMFWFRDHHLTGNPFKPAGIDDLSDEPPPQFRKKE